MPEPALDRAALLQLVAQARSAAAAGLDDLQEQRQLDGKQFEVRIRFGCKGPAISGGEKPVLGWSYDEVGKVLRLRALPTIMRDDPVFAAAKLQAIEAVEGFWIPRPWLLQPICPKEPADQLATGDAPEDESAPTPSPAADEKQVIVQSPKVGIAQFFTADDARTRRRDSRAYESVTSVSTVPDSSEGYDLVISGRLKAVADGRVILCTGQTPDRAPDCIISVRTDRVRFDNPKTGETLAQWSSS